MGADRQFGLSLADGPLPDVPPRDIVCSTIADAGATFEILGCDAWGTRLRWEDGPTCAAVAAQAGARRPRDLRVTVSGSHVVVVVRGRGDERDTVEARREMRADTAVLLAIRNLDRLTVPDGHGPGADVRQAVLASIDVPRHGCRPTADEAASVQLVIAELALPSRLPAAAMLSRLVAEGTVARLRELIG